MALVLDHRHLRPPKLGSVDQVECGQEVADLELLDFSSPPADFGQPLALVQASHERLRRMVELLIRLREHLLEHGADRTAAVSAGAIRQFLEQAWPRHMRDEELDFFPRIRARLRGRHTESAQNILETIEALIEQHRAFDSLWHRIAPALRAVESGSAQRLDEPAVQSFVELFRTHLALEDDVLDPAYARLLTAADLQQIGRAMAQRRGIAWPQAAPADEPTRR